MTGPEHYKEAQRLIGIGHEVVAEIRAASSGVYPDDWRDRRDDLGKQAMGIWAQAQVHATLSLAAATALGREGSHGTMPEREHDRWFAVAGTPKPVEAVRL